MDLISALVTLFLLCLSAIWGKHALRNLWVATKQPQGWAIFFRAVSLVFAAYAAVMLAVLGNELGFEPAVVGSLFVLGFVVGIDAMCAHNMGTSYIRRVISPFWWVRTVKQSRRR